MGLEVALVPSEHIYPLVIVETAEEVSEGGHLAAAKAQLPVGVEYSEIFVRWAAQQIV